MTETSPPGVVPCGTCHACCRRQWVVINPQAGDVPELYDTVDIVDPATGAPAKALAHRANGDCVYLGASGCTIHARVPAMCRDFDCRVYYAQIMDKPRTERKNILRHQYSAREMFEIGREMQDKHPVALPGNPPVKPV